MRCSIFGFSQELVVALNNTNESKLDVEDLLILDYLIYATASSKMKQIADTIKNESGEDEIKVYTWLDHSKILKDLPILDISERTLSSRLLKLKQLGLVESKTVCNDRGRGSRMFYHITEKGIELKLSDDDNKQKTADENDDHKQKTADGQSRPQAENCLSNNKLTNIDKELNNDSKSTRAKNFVDLYHSICKSLPSVRAITDARIDAVDRLYKKHSEEDILEVLHKAEESDFLSGRKKTDRNWSAGFDWILKEPNFIKTLEGNYDNMGGSTNKKKFAENDKIKSVGVTEEEKVNGYFTGETL